MSGQDNVKESSTAIEKAPQVYFKQLNLNTFKIKYFIVSFLLLSVWALFLFSPVSYDLSLSQSLSGAIVSSSILLFATRVIPEAVTALLLMTFGMLFSLAPAEIIFSGFSSTACWLIFSGLVIGIAVTETGLAQRFANAIAHHLHSSYLQLISGIVLIGILLGFVMPSSVGRAVLFMPIAVAIATNCGFDKNSNGRIGVVLAAAFGCHLPTFAILPANIPNMVMIGTAETIYNWTPLYAEYLLLHFPVLGFLKAILLVGLILMLYPDKPQAIHGAKQTEPMTGNEYKLLILMGITLCLWVTDSLHHISSAWIGLAAATFLLMPKVGLVSQESFGKKVNVNALIVVSGLLALGAVVNYSGIGILLGNHLIDNLPLSHGNDWLNFMTLSLSALAIAIGGTLPSVPALLTPMAEQLSINTGFSLQAVLMTQVFGFSTIVFPYQSVPLLMAIPLAGISLSHAARLCLYLAALTLVILLPVSYFWWQFIGWL